MTADPRYGLNFTWPIKWVTLEELNEMYPQGEGEKELVALENYPKWVAPPGESLPPLTVEKLIEQMKQMGSEMR